ncbi:MAG: hypothetical protein K8S55_10340 [Phycisphaerae bacterium]|nr:hypothetical protein [Phycisphaerae bacterium]
MNMTDEQYERIARYLDGEEVSPPLSAEELAVAEEIGQAETKLTGLLDVALPAAAEDRAKRRAVAAMAGRRRASRVGRAFGVGLSIASAAAVLLFAVNIWRETFRPPTQEPPTPVVSTNVWVKAMQIGDNDEFAIELDILAEQLDTEEAEIVDLTIADSSPATGFDNSMEYLQESVDKFWDTNTITISEEI